MTGKEVPPPGAQVVDTAESAIKRVGTDFACYNELVMDINAETHWIDKSSIINQRRGENEDGRRKDGGPGTAY